MSANQICNYIGYVANTAPPTPPPGVVYTFLGADGVTLQQINSAGTISGFGGGGGLSPIADQTMLGNISGGSAIPVGLTTAQVIALIGGNGLSVWAAAEAAAHKALLPTLTGSAEIVCARSDDGALLGTALADAGVEGGGVKGTGTGTIWAKFTKAAIWQNMKTSVWAVSFLGALPVPAASNVSVFGTIDPSVTGGVVVSSENAKSATNFVGYANDGTPTAPVLLGTADTAIHTWRIVSDGTTITWYRDGVSVGTMATSTAHVPTFGGMPGLYSNVAGAGQALYRIVYSYHGPLA